jgi:phasin
MAVSAFPVMLQCSIYVAAHNKVRYKSVAPGPNPVEPSSRAPHRGKAMNTFEPKVAAEKARETAVQFEALTLKTLVPEGVRSIAEKTVAHTREAYEHSKDALEGGLDALERSFDAAGQGSLALNHKLIEIAQRNVNSGFSLARSLAAAKTLPDVVEVQATYWRNWLGTFTAQAEELRALSANVTADTAEPIKAHVTRGMNELRKAS